MSSARKVVVFGVYSGIKPVKNPDGEIVFADEKSPEHLAEYDMIIYQCGAFNHKYNVNWLASTLEPVPAGAIRRENELRSALERGRIVCIIGFHAEDYVVAGILNSYDIPKGLIDHGKVFRDLLVKRSEFKSYLDDVGATQIGFNKDSIDDAICYAEAGVVTGFSKKLGKGLLLFLPTVWGSTEPGYILDHLKRLVTALIAFLAKHVLEAPAYVEQFQFTKEKKAKEKMEAIMKEEVAPLKRAIEHYEGMKSILWLGDSDLVMAVERFLRKMSFQTEIDEICEEDLWIRDDKKRVIVVEVKGLNKNLTRQDISKLDEHREARELPSLTGLLIANTFMAADSLKNKDQPFPPNVIEKAVSANLLITRTIDLCRIYDQSERGDKDISKVLLEAMIGKKGWLTFQDGEIRIVTS